MTFLTFKNDIFFGEIAHKAFFCKKRNMACNGWLVCVWFVFGLCLVCVWFVSGLCLVCVFSKMSNAFWTSKNDRKKSYRKLQKMKVTEKKVFDVQKWQKIAYRKKKFCVNSPGDLAYRCCKKIMEKKTTASPPPHQNQRKIKTVSLRFPKKNRTQFSDKIPFFFSKTRSLLCWRSDSGGGGGEATLPLFSYNIDKGTINQRF